MRKLFKRNCVNCGHEFLTYELDKVYCSLNCECEAAPDGLHDITDAKPIACKYCGKVFGRRRNNQYYCSSECSKIARRLYIRAYHKKLRGKKK